MTGAIIENLIQILRREIRASQMERAAATGNRGRGNISASTLAQTLGQEDNLAVSSRNKLDPVGFVLRSNGAFSGAIAPC
jgi:hypothetical protein